ncbi:O-antigen ligase family protein [Synechococcus sp. CS-1330]|nr:O-antigen ligase family protein [Synechococcus sp. CS-1330]
MFDVLLFLGLVGIFYPGWGRVMAWLSCAAALASYYELNINPVMLRNGVILLLPMIVTTLFASSMVRSAGAILDIVLGLCMFLPGVLFGRRLFYRPLQWAPLAVTFLFVLTHFAFPLVYLDRISYGFFDNPNLNGRGLAYVALLLGILIWAFVSSDKGGISRFRLGVLASLFTAASVGVISLLILTNYRAGWIAIAFFSVTSFFIVARVSNLLKTAVLALFSGGLVGLIRFVDVKGFAYGSVGERLLMWHCSLESWIKNYFWFGSGFDSFKNLRLACLPESAIDVHSYPHNISIELLLSGGLVGFACVLIFVAYEFKALNRAGCFSSPVASAALCAILGLLMSGQLGMKFASFTFIGSISALVGIAYSQSLRTGSSICDS